MRAADMGSGEKRCPHASPPTLPALMRPGEAISVAFDCSAFHGADVAFETVLQYTLASDAVRAMRFALPVHLHAVHDAVLVAELKVATEARVNMPMFASLEVHVLGGLAVDSVTVAIAPSTAFAIHGPIVSTVSLKGGKATVPLIMLPLASGVLECPSLSVVKPNLPTRTIVPPLIVVAPATAVPVVCQQRTQVM